MREEKLARCASGALAILPIAFIPAYFCWGFTFACSVLFYGLGCTAIGIASGRLLGRRHAALQIAASALPSALLALALPPVQSESAWLIRAGVMALGVALAVWMERRYVVSDAPLKPERLLTPLLTMLIASAILWFSGKSDGTNAQTAGTLFLILGAIWFVAALFLINRLSMRIAAHAETHGEVPEGARRSGTVGIVAFIIVTFLFAGISNIVGALSTAFKAVASWLLQAYLFLSSLFESKGAKGAPQDSGGQDAFPMGGGKASPIADLIYKIIVVILLLAVTAAIIYGLYRFFPKLWNKLRARFSGLFANWREEEADYHDHAENLMSLKQALSGAGARLTKLAKRFRRKPRIDDYRTNAEKVRFLFREHLHALTAARREPPAGATATEIAKTLPALANAYNRARYAGEEPGNDEVKKAMEQTEKTK